VAGRAHAQSPARFVVENLKLNQSGQTLMRPAAASSEASLTPQLLTEAVPVCLPPKPRRVFAGPPRHHLAFTAIANQHSGDGAIPIDGAAGSIRSPKNSRLDLDNGFALGGATGMTCT